MKTVGPKVSLQLTCHHCENCLSTHYACQGDSGHTVHCTHPDVRSSEGDPRYIGDSNWSTPQWCPLRDRAIQNLLVTLATEK